MKPQSEPNIHTRSLFLGLARLRKAKKLTVMNARVATLMDMTGELTLLVNQIQNKLPGMELKSTMRKTRPVSVPDSPSSTRNVTPTVTNAFTPNRHSDEYNL